MDCFINVGTLHSLRKLVGNDDALFSACYSEAVGTNKQPTRGFSKWYEETHDGKKLDVNDFAKEALEYHYFLHPDGNVTARKKETDHLMKLVLSKTLLREKSLLLIRLRIMLKQILLIELQLLKVLIEKRLFLSLRKVFVILMIFLILMKYLLKIKIFMLYLMKLLLVVELMENLMLL